MVVIFVAAQIELDEKQMKKQLINVERLSDMKWNESQIWMKLKDIKWTSNENKLSNAYQIDF